MLVEAYFDESISEGGKLLCVAGYLIEKGQSELLAAEWRAMLAAFGLDYFHMVECAHGKAEPFSLLDEPERVRLAFELIEVIKRRTVQGLGATIDLTDFTARFGETCFFGTAYSVCFHKVIRGAALWAEKTEYNGEIAYFFEAGHSSGNEAKQLMNIGLRDPKIKSEMRYAGHAFVEKKKSPQVQAADLFAWQLIKDMKNYDEGRRRRKDYENLTSHQHNVAHITATDLANLEPFWEAQRQSAIEMLGYPADKTLTSTKPPKHLSETIQSCV
ncbi:MAG: DUF3800 domain-containing protein [Rhizomicrobium sp.]